jgi:hypothetical protein
MNTTRFFIFLHRLGREDVTVFREIRHILPPHSVHKTEILDECAFAYGPTTDVPMCNKLYSLKAGRYFRNVKTKMFSGFEAKRSRDPLCVISSYSIDLRFDSAFQELTSLPCFWSFIVPEVKRCGATFIHTDRDNQTNFYSSEITVVSCYVVCCMQLKKLR